MDCATQKSDGDTMNSNSLKEIRHIPKEQNKLYCGGMELMT